MFWSSSSEFHLRTLSNINFNTDQQQTHPAQSQVMAITPTATDIKSGGGNHNHPGNSKVYLKLVATNRKSNVLAHKDIQTKNEIELSIYEAIRKQSPPGRFLEKNKDGSYSVRSKENACKKIKKALKENKATIEKYFQLRGLFPPPTEHAAKQNAPTKVPYSEVPSENGKCRKRPTSEIKKTQTDFATSSDWLKLVGAKNHIDPEHFKTIKRQKTRTIRHPKKKSNKNKKTSKEESRNNDVDKLCDTIKNLCLEKTHKRKISIRTSSR